MNGKWNSDRTTFTLPHRNVRHRSGQQVENDLGGKLTVIVPERCYSESGFRLGWKRDGEWVNGMEFDLKKGQSISFTGWEIDY